jgi:predicted O-methyltransferase YrrM
MNNYKFTKDWFTSDEMIGLLPDVNSEIHILEIGSYEGKSTVWFLNNVLKNTNSTITCIDPWMNFYQNTDSFNSYNPNTKTLTGVDFIKDDIKGRFLHNINETGKSQSVKVKHGTSYDELPKLLTDNQKYDIIYIDGNHTAPFVLTDAVMSWYLLKEGGLMVFDDYLWGNYNQNPTLCPKLAVDSFFNCFKDYSQKIKNESKFILKKVKK